MMHHCALIYQPNKCHASSLINVSCERGYRGQSVFPLASGYNQHCMDQSLSMFHETSYFGISTHVLSKFLRCKHIYKYCVATNVYEPYEVKHGHQIVS